MSQNEEKLLDKFVDNLIERSRKTDKFPVYFTNVSYLISDLPPNVDFIKEKLRYLQNELLVKEFEKSNQIDKISENLTQMTTSNLYASM